MNEKSFQKGVFILCAGGHGRVVIGILRENGIIPAGITDSDSSRSGADVDGIPIIGDDDSILHKNPRKVVLVNAMGNRAGRGSSDLEKREAFYSKFKKLGFEFMQIISPSAAISDQVVLEEGCHIMTGAIVHPGTTVGVDSIINTGATLDHDCCIGPHCHVAPGAVLCGGVEIGRRCHIGAGAVVIPGVAIGDDAVVGAGAVVIRDVAAGVTVTGNPANPVTDRRD